MITKNFLTAAISGAGALLLLSGPAAQAVPTLRLSDGITTVTVADGAFNDMTAAVGAVTFSGAIGVWTVNVSTGASDPALGTPTSPSMDINSLDISGGAGTLTIWFSDDFFGPTSSGVSASIGGTINNKPGSSLTYKTYADGSNTLFAETLLLTSQSFTSGAFSGDASGGLPSDPYPAPYSLTQKLVITHAGAGATSFDATLMVPDGGSTVALLGFALLGIEGLRRKLRLA
jgi:hypothetical protein